MEQQHEEENHQWVAEEEEEMEEATLKGRQSQQHLKKNVITSVVGSSSSSSSSSSPTSIRGGHSDGVRSVMTHPDETTTITTSTASQNRSSAYFEDKEGSEASNGPSRVQNGEDAGTVIPTNYGSEVNNQCMKTVEDKGPFSSDLLEEVDLRLRELDVEAVLAKQETHDLFCPNCNSCITKRVILRKRKRNIHNLDPKATRDKFETIVSSKLVDGSAYEANQGDHAIITSDVGILEPTADNYNPERESEVFRCLSCFKYFIPTGNGFNLFRRFVGAGGQETSQNSSSIRAYNLQNPSRLPVSDVKNPSNIQASNTNWFFSLFISNLRKTAIDASLEHSERNPAEHNHLSPITSNMLASPEIGCPEGLLADTFIIKNGKPSPDIKPKDGGVKIESHTAKDFKSKIAFGNESLADPKCLASLLQNDSSTILSCTQTVGNVTKELQKVGKDLVDFSTEEQILTGNVRTGVGEKKNDLVYIKKTAVTSEAVVYAGEAAKHPTPEHCEGEPDFLVPSNVESPILEKSKKDIYKKSNMEIEDKLIVQNSHSPLMQGSQLPAQSFCSVVLANGATTDIQSSGGDTKSLPEQDPTLVEKVKKEIEEEINPVVRKEDKGSDVIVFVEAEAVKSTAFGMADSVPVEGAILTETSSQVYVGEQAGDEIGEPKGLEILKSIVYGGLVESITSLGIVSSAVSAGSASLSIIALGLANLVGGFFIIGHNLSELKNYHSGGDPQQMNKQEDRYHELLGRRENFVLHAVVAVLSFLIFGSVPLVVYGILIRENYNDEVKIAAVAATSLACIFLLAIAEVYTKRPPKSYIKTVVYYVTLALAASGMSYIVGGLIKDLLEKFSQTESGLVISMPISEKMEPAWTSY